VSSSQGSKVFVNGTLVGRLLNIAPAIKAGQAFNITHIGSPVIGRGGDARIVQQLNCASVEPGSMTCQLLGLPGVSINAGGSVQLSFNVAGYSLSGEAFLDSFQPVAAVGDFVRCSMTFQFTGF
jgi:hypothetical protein